MRAAVLAQAFGVPYTLRPNILIARIASRKAREVDGVIFTQRDIRPEPGVAVVYVSEKPGRPPRTLRMCREAVRWAISKDVREIWLACAKPHLSRCERDLRFAVREANADIRVRICEEVISSRKEEWWAPESKQWRVRSEAAWIFSGWAFEKFVPMWLYKLIAR